MSLRLRFQARVASEGSSWNRITRRGVDPPALFHEGSHDVSFFPANHWDEFGDGGAEVGPVAEREWLDNGVEELLEEGIESCHFGIWAMVSKTKYAFIVEDEDVVDEVWCFRWWAVVCVEVTIVRDLWTRAYLGTHR